MWQHGDKNGLQKVIYKEDDQQEHLNDALTREQKDILLKKQ